MARFYLDENLPEYLVICLQDLGHDAVSTTQLDRKGVSDPEQLLLAHQVNRVLITFNSDDFRMVHKAWIVWSRAWGTEHYQHAGILILRRGAVGSLDNRSAERQSEGRAVPHDWC